MPRPYNRHRRDEAMAQTRRRIIEAVVDLHAEHGAHRTTYAMIAARADVAIPTVYKHFPTLTELFAGCVGHVSAQAPALGPEILAGLAGVPARLDALVRALFARHRFFSPWLRWSVHETHLLPELAVHHHRMREAETQLIREALVPAFGPHPPPAVLGLAEHLVGFGCWQKLTREHGLSDDDAVETVRDALIGLLERHADTSHAPAPEAPVHMKKGIRS